MDYPPLLAPGLHPRTWNELEQLCVTDFPLSQSRALIFAGLRRIVDLLVNAGVRGELWVDGSYLSRKIEPGDVDIVLNVDLGFLAGASVAQQAMISGFNSSDRTLRAEIKRDYSCDSYFFCDVPIGHPLYPGIDMRQYWLSQFGSDRSGNAKGIAVLSIPGGVL